MKNSKLTTYVVLCVTLFLLQVAPLFAKSKSEDMFLTCEMNKKELYERESGLMLIKLHTKNPNVSFANKRQDPSLEDGQFSFIKRVENNQKGKKETIDGEEYYSYVIDTYLLTMHDKGSYKINGGSYEIGVQQPVVVEDPFWGRMRRTKTEKVELSVPSLKLKVKSLPSQKSDSDFSGVVGNFSIETTIPPGDIVLNETCLALITIKGNGLIGNDIMPEYAGAFNSTAKLRSMTENRRTYFDGNDIVSELVLECEFVPETKDAEIGEVRLGIFNPTTGKYETAVSSPVKVKVKSITSKLDAIEI